MDDIKEFTDYELYSAYYTLKKQMQVDAERAIDNYGSDVEARLFAANEHLPNVLGVIKIEREMKSRGLKP